MDKFSFLNSLPPVDHGYQNPTVPFGNTDGRITDDPRWWESTPAGMSPEGIAKLSKLIEVLNAVPQEARGVPKDWRDRSSGRGGGSVKKGTGRFLPWNPNIMDTLTASQEQVANDTMAAGRTAMGLDPALIVRLLGALGMR